MASVEFIVEEREKKDGAGANFVVAWNRKNNKWASYTGGNDFYTIWCFIYNTRNRNKIGSGRLWY